MGVGVSQTKGGGDRSIFYNKKGGRSKGVANFNRDGWVRMLWFSLLVFGDHGCKFANFLVDNLLCRISASFYWVELLWICDMNDHNQGGVHMCALQQCNIRVNYIKQLKQCKIPVHSNYCASNILILQRVKLVYNCIFFLAYIHLAVQYFFSVHLFMKSKK